MRYESDKRCHDHKNIVGGSLLTMKNCALHSQFDSCFLRSSSDHAVEIYSSVLGPHRTVMQILYIPGSVVDACNSVPSFFSPSDQGVTMVRPIGVVVGGWRERGGEGGFRGRLVHR